MAVTETLEKNAVTMKLNIGLDAQGNVKTANVGLGTLDIVNPATTWDAQKAMNIVEALSACLTKPVYSVIRTATSVMVD